MKGVRYRESISEYSPKNTGLYLGKVIGIKKDYIKLQLKEDIDLHDGIECIDNLSSSTIITCIRDENFNVVNRLVEKGNKVWLGDIRNVKVGDEIYKTSSYSLNEKYKKYAYSNLKKLTYDVNVNIQNNKKLQATVDGICVEIAYIPEIAKTSGLSEQKVKEAFSKTENTSIRLNVIANIETSLFVPIAKLNELRNVLVENIEQNKLVRREIQDIAERIQSALELKLNKINSEVKQHSLYVYKYDPSKDYVKYYKSMCNEKLDIIYVNAVDFKYHEKDIFKYSKQCKIYFVIPNVTLVNVTNYIYDNLQRLVETGVSGVLLGNIGFLDICNEIKNKHNIEIVADYTLNITNKYTALKYQKLGIDVFTPLIERSLDIANLSMYFNTEQVLDLACVMTTRYCIISSFVKASNKPRQCNCECIKQNYYLLDEQNKRYDIVTDNLDCITKLVTSIPNKLNNEKNSRVRRCIM